MMLLPVNYFGHAFGEDFSLPLPLRMFIFASIAALVLSFILSGMLFDNKSTAAKTYAIKVPAQAFRNVARALSVLLLAVTIVAGFVGNQLPGTNFNFLFFWIIFLVGFTYVTVFFGNIWSFINPFKALVELSEKIIRRQSNGVFVYPRVLSYYPALLLFFLLIWLERLNGKFAATPLNLSLLLLIYALVSVVGSWLIGKAVWFRYVDYFSVFFRLIAKTAPLAYEQGRIVLRWPFSGFLEGSAHNFSILLFVLFMLASTSFDGFTETKQYDGLQALLPGFLSDSAVVYGTLLLLLFPFIFLGLYMAFMAIAKAVARSEHSVLDLCYAFAFSLIPIAIGYHVAHYLTYLVINGQNIIKMASDPFNVGWNIFGTADFVPNQALFTPYATWYIQVGAIIIGHVAAVYIAHKIAIRVFDNRKQAVVSQLPVMGLMILYTVFSLWIIAQPVYIAQEQVQVQRREEFDRIEGIREPPKPVPPQ